MSRALITLGLLIIFLSIFIYFQPKIQGQVIAAPLEPASIILGVVLVLSGLLLTLKRREENEE
ncbi:MAG: hypothetical protein DRP12_02850 [Candidatus Aenigmatarchaeota archaeon]|nr:MAG: hypothetical protein DRP12_02850 [Candidatus Aenigmarchaeota archaeon]